jgi:hypothetical protein
MKYKLVPIEEFTKKPEVIEICKMLGSVKGSRQDIKQQQKAAQAAAWHYTDNMSWEQLATKVGVTHIHGPSEPFFTRAQLHMAQRIAVVATQRARENPRYQDPSFKDKEDSLSNQ